MSFFPEPALKPGESQASELQSLYGFVPRIFRLQAAIPGILESQIRLLEALLNDERHLSRSQKEQILLAVSLANRSSYGVALHEQMLKLVGSATIDPQDTELTAFARNLILRPTETQQTDVDRLRNLGFTRAQIVEVVVLVGFGNFLNTLQAGFGAVPDFAPRPIPAPPIDNNVHPADSNLRPIVEEVADDPDTDCVIRAQKGDLGAFETLVERHTQRVYRTLVGLLGNPEDTRDALQDTFLNAYRNLGRFERRSKFATWLTSIASNVGLQRLRDRKQLVSLDDDSSDQEEYRPRQIRAWDDNPEQRYSKAEQRDLVERAISRLPVKYRVVVVLRDVQQLSTEEAAGALGLSVPAIKARLLRARLMLRESLAPHFSEGAHGA